MPFFDPGDDPGANFPELLRRVGLDPAQPVTRVATRSSGSETEI